MNLTGTLCHYSVATTHSNLLDKYKSKIPLLLILLLILRETGKLGEEEEEEEEEGEFTKLSPEIERKRIGYQDAPFERLSLLLASCFV